MSLKCWGQWLYHVLLVSLVRAVADVLVGILYLLSCEIVNICQSRKSLTS